MRLEVPDERWCESYRGLVREFFERGEQLVPFTLSFPNDDFSAFLKKLSDCAQGVGIPEGFVAHSTFWLVRDDVDVVGVSNLRHTLTDRLRHEGGSIGYGVRPTARRRGYASELLRRTLIQAREIGCTDVLLTCAKSNLASVHTILSGGGVFESEEYMADRDEVVQRYVFGLG